MKGATEMPARKLKGRKENPNPMIEVGKLKPGTRFIAHDGRRGTLIHANFSRAHVRIGGKLVTIKGNTFMTGEETDWSPGTLVEPMETEEEAQDDVVFLDPETGDVEEVILDPETGEIKKEE